MTYIEERIDALSKGLDALREEHEALVEGVRYLHSQITHDEPQVQQTTEEFVRIIRCKDCKWYVNDTEVYDTCGNEDGMFRPSGEDYCSMGEKMEGVTE